MNDETRDFIQGLANKLEIKHGSEVVEIFYEYFSSYIEEGMSTIDAGNTAFVEAEKDALEDETLTRMG